jgi:nucleoside-diphosphate-sugar epimerase
MHILVTGAAGMIGRKLVNRMVAEGTIGTHPLTALTLTDIVAPLPPAGFTGRVVTREADLSVPGEAEHCLAGRPDIIVHLAAIVSGEAEADLEKGYRVNLDGTRLLFDAIRRIGDGYKPRVIFTSSVAAYGPPFPALVPDDFRTTPTTSYGAQKVMGEAMLSDYSRRGLMDGIAIRLPTICIRPGKPNKAASGFFSGILREPLIGQEAILPVGEDVRCWVASPRAAVGFLMHATTIDLAPLGAQRALMMPGLSVAVGEQIAALRRAAGENAVKLIRHEPNPTIIAIVSGWAVAFDPQRALALGFRAENSFDEIVRTHIEDELGGKVG